MPPVRRPVERYFAVIDEKVDFDLVSVMPINVRKEGEKTVGSVLSAGRVNLHNTIGDLPGRLRAIV